jgi:spermidine synthase
LRAATAAPVLREDEEGIFFDFDNGIVQSRMLPDEPTQLVLEYTRLMMGFLLFQPTPARIAMIGLGGGSLAKYCRLHLPDADFTAVEISPEVIALRDAFDIEPDGALFRIRCEDGGTYVRRAGAPLDVLLIDAFDRDGLPAHLATAAFYDACRDRLTDDGVLVVNLHCDDPAYRDYLERIGLAFDKRMVVVDADDTDNAVAFAGAGKSFPPVFKSLVARLRKLEAAHPVELGTTLRKILDYRPRRQRRK